MSDYLVDLAQNGPARTIIKKLGLPVPLPVKLRRATGAWQAKPLLGHSIGKMVAARQRGDEGEPATRIEPIFTPGGEGYGIMYVRSW